VASTGESGSAGQIAASPANAGTALASKPEQTASKEKSEKELRRHRALFDQSTAASQPVLLSGAACNIPVCSGFYHSFRASDCTYQPYSGGPRRLCER